MPNCFTYTDRNGEHNILFKDIVRFVAEGNYVRVILTNGSVRLVSKQLCEVEAGLPANHSFLRIHRSHLVHLAYVAKVGKTRKPLVVMQFGLPVRARRKMIVALKRMCNKRK